MRTISNVKVADDTYTYTNLTVGTSTTNLIPSVEIYGAKGNIGVENTGANDITVYPRVSNDGSIWFELDNGSGTTVTSGSKKVFPFTGNYRYIKLDAVATTATTADATLYVSTL